MTPFRSILMWGGAATAVAFVLFIGHAIALRETGPVFWGFVLLAISATLIFLQSRFARDEPGGHH